jgi:hypothetical protein
VPPLLVLADAAELALPVAAAAPVLELELLELLELLEHAVSAAVTALKARTAPPTARALRDSCTVIPP